MVIGHRGASGYRPEHTLASYALAARLGADYIEPDLVATKDGVLVARHENEIGTTTDVAGRPEFADRRRTKAVDGISLTGWFTEDFTLAELKGLRAQERIPQLRQRGSRFDGRYAVPTFQEVLDLRARLSWELGREIGVYPETKHPTYFQSIGLPLEPPLIRALRENGLDRREAPVFVQSFETTNLRALDRELEVPMVQLLGATGAPFDLVASGSTTTYAALSGAAGLRGIAEYADAIGPDKAQLLPRTAAGASAPPTGLVADAHRAGLLVHPYTFRVENAFLPLELRSSGVPAEAGDLFGELAQVYALGADAVFCDNPDIAVEARDDAAGDPRDR